VREGKRMGNEAWYDVRGRGDIHGDMTFKVIRGQGQGEEMTSVPFRDYFSVFIQTFFVSDIVA